MLNLTDLAIFSQVVETKSFSAAAQRLSLSKATVSKRIAALEIAVGSPLLHRTTRQVKLTETGAALFQHCTRIMREAREAALSIARTTGTSRQTVKVTAPTKFGLNFVLHPITAALREFPDLGVDVSLTNRSVDLVAEGVDLAIRIASETSNELVWHPLTPCPTTLCAAPSYLASAGALICPPDLRNHACLICTVPKAHQYWSFRKDGEDQLVHVSGRFLTDSGEAMRLAALDGLGIALMPCFYIDHDLRVGALTSVLRDYATPEFTAYAVYPFASRASGAVIALVDRIAAACGRGGTACAPNDVRSELSVPAAP
ncbi:MAG: LysR family transcriptional regulator [Proteobacteria bacterium]|nr:LysR family transcriptional regulator [Pseudomonadota bacterium]